MSAAHTPGPWVVNDLYADTEIRGPQNSGVMICVMSPWGIAADEPSPQRANARLIAAAPTMHGALIEAAQAAQDAFSEALRDVPEGSCVPPWITRLQQAAERAHAALVTADERFKPLNQQPYPTR